MNRDLAPGARLKEKLHAGTTSFGLWVSMESPAIVEIASHAGLDWVCIDMEHGALGMHDVENHLRALGGSKTAGLVRVPAIEPSCIQRALGLGAHGILAPRVRTAEDVERAVSFAKYPPKGSRGMGAERSTWWGTELALTSNANRTTLVIPIIETVEAGRNIESILDVNGVDAFFFGPADFSASAGFTGQWEAPGIDQEILRIEARARARRIPCGVVATDAEDGRFRLRQGFQMIGLGVDGALMLKTIKAMRDELKHSAKIAGTRRNLPRGAARREGA